METYHVTYKTVTGMKQTASFEAESKDAARSIFNSMACTDNNNMFFDCTITRVWLKKPQTEKQKLSQKYGFTMGCIKSAEAQVNFAMNTANSNTEKQLKAHILVKHQFAKLKRDIADLFRLAGLKIK